ncbi:MAG: DUF5103 domain-containing protein [Reichenbachiella sp.]
MKKSLLFCVLLIITSLSFAQRGMVFEDKKFHKDVGVVQLFPILNSPNQEREAPFVLLGQRTDLMLRFDLLREEYDVIQAKIIHCNLDWKQSDLNDIDFLQDFNVFDIINYDYSINSKELYVNYWMKLPKVKRSGNYVVMVYADSNPNKVIFTRRFIVFENLVGIAPNLRASTSVRYRFINQQIDFALNYGGVKVGNPYSELKVVLRQNNRWDNAIFDLRPTNVNAGIKQLRYNSFNAENNFRGGNEFRSFDLRLTSFRGMNVSRIEKTSTTWDAYVITDKSRKKEVYSQIRDMNGGFFIGTNEPNAGFLEEDYVNTHFTIKSEELLDEVYVIGAFNDWKKDQYSRMVYDQRTQTYQSSVKLKQGYYDYMYWVEGADNYALENSFYQTKNNYEILVYYRGFTDLADRVIGYSSFLSE